MGASVNGRRSPGSGGSRARKDPAGQGADRQIRKAVLKRFCCAILCVPLLLAAALCIGVLLDRAVYRTESALYPRKYIALVESAAERYALPESVIYAVIRTESNFKEDAVSWAGAMGLMQVTYDTFDWIYFRRGETADRDKILIPSYNIDAGCALLAWLYERYGDWKLVYAAYNAGFGRVDKWLSDPEISENGVLVNIPITETDAYVRYVSAAEETYRQLYDGDINRFAEP